MQASRAITKEHLVKDKRRREREKKFSRSREGVEKLVPAASRSRGIRSRCPHVLQAANAETGRTALKPLIHYLFSSFALLSSGSFERAFLFLRRISGIIF